MERQLLRNEKPVEIELLEGSRRQYNGEEPELKC